MANDIINHVYIMELPNNSEVLGSESFWIAEHKVALEGWYELGEWNLQSLLTYCWDTLTCSPPSLKISYNWHDPWVTS
jgi:hypothetical protein